MMVTIENLKVFFAKIKTIFVTKDELNSGLNTKANRSHGNHVPTTGSADNTMFLRNDNTWQKVTPSNIGAAPTSHGTHVTYSTTVPAAPGTASAGTASTVARTDHVHPAQTSVSGNAGTATKLQTARTINGVSFDGSANITITAAANGGTSAACSGNAATATKLQTARTINGTNFNGTAAITTANWGTARTLTVGNTGKSVNGSGNVSWSLAEIGALPLAGGTLTGAIAFSNSGTTTRGITGTVGDNDYWRVVGGATASDAGFMEIATANDGNEPIYVRQYTGVFATVKRTVTLLDGNGNTTFPGKVNTDSIRVKNCSLQYNTTTESLDFIFA